MFSFTVFGKQIWPLREKKINQYRWLNLKFTAYRGGILVLYFRTCKQDKGDMIY